MNKLRKKLTALGYKHKNTYKEETWFIKQYDEAEDIMIVIYIENGIIDPDFCQVEIDDKRGFLHQSVIDHLYIKLTGALKQLHSDLRILTEYENKA